MKKISALQGLLPDLCLFLIFNQRQKHQGSLYHKFHVNQLSDREGYTSRLDSAKETLNLFLSQCSPLCSFEDHSLLSITRQLNFFFVLLIDQSFTIIFQSIQTGEVI